MANGSPPSTPTLARMTIPSSLVSGEQARGLAPMLLCGIALAESNEHCDQLGRGPGILTAEELASLDLSGCDLAVLSACETNVGMRCPGQGIQSLQAATYAARARCSITSLWKVDDAATRRLFELFYSNLWEGDSSITEALWHAKLELRKSRLSASSWVAWVNTSVIY